MNWLIRQLGADKILRQIGLEKFILSYFEDLILRNVKKLDKTVENALYVKAKDIDRICDKLGIDERDRQPVYEAFATFAKAGGDIVEVLAERADLQ